MWRSLHDGWVCTLATPCADVPERVSRGLPVPATVPGAVHTDLMAAGLLPDPYQDRNELEVAWVGHHAWSYSTSFTWRDDGWDHVALVFHGLDTVATVLLNDVEVLSTANMHRSYRVPVGHLLEPGENRLRVTFTSAWEYAEQGRAAAGPLPTGFPAPYNFIRKMACSFGWDWGPSTVTSGIWRPVGLESWNAARITEVRPHVTVEGDEGVARFHVEVEGAPGEAPRDTTTVTVRVGHRESSAQVSGGQGGTDVEVRVPRPDLWWPRGLGEPRTYPAEVVLTDGTGRRLDRWRREIGFRNVRLDTTPDDEGTPFVIVVNDRPVPVRGANWIPDDAFPHRVGPARYAERVRQAADANLNLLRVWGGGIYEDEAFYDACDRAGVLVWQDFAFACAAYPEEEPLRSEVEAEARENVVRLMPHPSLVLWNGENECLWGWFDGGWPEQVGDRTWGSGYYLDVLPRVVADTDPTRPYWPGTPYSGSMDLHPNADEHALRHVWEVWNEVDYLEYRACSPRFVSEFGFQGPPTWHTLRSSLTDDPLTADSPGLVHHQKAEDGMGKLRRGMAPHLPEPVSVDDWHYLAQVNQARAVTVGVEHFRSLPTCSGAVVWQLNDCWPVISWAAVDGQGRPKPLWYALRGAFAPRLLTFQPRGRELALVAVNDETETWTDDVTVRRMDFDGAVLAEHRVRVSADGLGRFIATLPAAVATPHRPVEELLVATTSTGGRALWFFAEDKDLAYRPADLDVRCDPTGDGVRIAVGARTLVRDLCVFVDRVEPTAIVSDMLLTLLPGETRTVDVAGVSDDDADRLLTRPVLRCLNDCVGLPEALD